MKFSIESVVYDGTYHELVKVDPCLLYPDGFKHVVVMNAQSGDRKTIVELSTQKLAEHKENRRELRHRLYEADEFEIERQIQLEASKLENFMRRNLSLFIVDPSDVWTAFREPNGDLVVVILEDERLQNFAVFKGTNDELLRLPHNQVTRASRFSDSFCLHGTQEGSAWSLSFWKGPPKSEGLVEARWNDQLCIQSDVGQSVFTLNLDHSVLVRHATLGGRIYIKVPPPPAL